MSIKLIAIKCPSCNANLEMEKGRTEMFCIYCGTKVMLSNDNERIYRRIDDAEILKQKNKKLQLILEDKEKNRKDKRKESQKKGASIY
ncbi:MAG: hypothetical protein NC093_03375 [Alistipes sp.]|nr:hypothetical protein [Alistipes sp.]